MFRVVSLSVFVAFLYGCMHLIENDYLYGHYSEYKKSVDESKLIESYTQYFDPVLTSGLDVNKPSIKSQLEFSKYMVMEESHYEVMQKDKGCLTVNGVDENNAAVAFYIQYNRSNERWLISDIGVSFLDTRKKYEQKALCPEQTKVQ